MSVKATPLSLNIWHSFRVQSEESGKNYVSLNCWKKPIPLDKLDDAVSGVEKCLSNEHYELKQLVSKENPFCLNVEENMPCELILFVKPVGLPVGLPYHYDIKTSKWERLQVEEVSEILSSLLAGTVDSANCKCKSPFFTGK
jgi:hypothetical protein